MCGEVVYLRAWSYNQMPAARDSMISMGLSQAQCSAIGKSWCIPVGPDGRTRALT